MIRVNVLPKKKDMNDIQQKWRDLHFKILNKHSQIEEQKRGLTKIDQKSKSEKHGHGRGVKGDKEKKRRERGNKREVTIAQL